jgi:hypothetical protein
MANTTQQTQATGELTAALIALHLGPGPHPDGSPQSVHAGGAVKVPPPPARIRKPKTPPAAQMGFDLDAVAPPAPPQWQGKYRASTAQQERVAAGLQDALDVADLTPADAERALATFRAWTTEKPLCIRRGQRGALGVLRDGRFKTQFETGTSSGMFDMAARRASEAAGLGIPTDAPVGDRPIYGYFDVQGEDASNYGSVQFVLKDAVKARTTATAGDSLGLFAADLVIGTPCLAPAIGSLDGEIGNINRGYRDSMFYVEAQIQGGVTLDDVQELVFKKSTYKYHTTTALWESALYPDYREIAAAARARGIPIRADYAHY